jgi:large subunit ribosomal protein L2
MEGNSHPLGALPVGSIICLVQQLPDSLWVEVRKGEEKAEILRKIGDRVIVKSSNGLEYSYDETCQCVVGVVSIHPLKKCDIGSPNRLRWVDRLTGHLFAFGRQQSCLPKA